MSASGTALEWVKVPERSEKPTTLAATIYEIINPQDELRASPKAGQIASV